MNDQTRHPEGEPWQWSEPTWRRIVGRARPRMHHHSRGLVDNRQIVVFIEDVQRNLLCHGAQSRPLRRAENGDALAPPQLERSLRGSIIHRNLVFRDQLLRPSPAHVELCRKQLIQTFAGVVRRDGNKNWNCLRH